MIIPPGNIKSFRIPGREGFPAFSEEFSYRDFFRAPCSGFQLYGKRLFTGIDQYHPPGIFLSFPRVFWLSGRASDSVPTGQWEIEKKRQTEFRNSNQNQTSTIADCFFAFFVWDLVRILLFALFFR